MGFERAMVVFAHPDDAEFGSAGTVAKWVDEGVDVAYVCVTDGSAGINDPGWTRPQIAEVRKREQRAACDVLGVEDLTFLDVMDGVVELTLDLRKAITRQVRRFRPDVLVAPDPTRWWDDGRTYVNHTDHRTVGQACMAVVSYDSSSRPVFSELLDEGLEPVEIKNLWISSFDADADTFVDISTTIDRKLEALHAHASQLRDERVDEWVRQRAKERGAPRGLEYAECYMTFRLREED